MIVNPVIDRGRQVKGNIKFDVGGVFSGCYISTEFLCKPGEVFWVVSISLSRQEGTTINNYLFQSYYEPKNPDLETTETDVLSLIQMAIDDGTLAV